MHWLVSRSCLSCSPLYAIAPIAAVAALFVLIWVDFRYMWQVYPAGECDFRYMWQFPTSTRTLGGICAAYLRFLVSRSATYSVNEFLHDLASATYSANGLQGLLDCLWGMGVALGAGPDCSWNGCCPWDRLLNCSWKWACSREGLPNCSQEWIAAGFGIVPEKCAEAYIWFANSYDRGFCGGT